MERCCVDSEKQKVRRGGVRRRVGGAGSVGGMVAKAKKRTKKTAVFKSSSRCFSLILASAVIKT